jgi:hypothetical protein
MALSNRIIWSIVLTIGTPIAALANWEVEVDPVAYALSGYSAHVGYRSGALRTDLGLYGAKVPETWHGNTGWTERTRGFGAKIDTVCSGKGWFAGIEVNYGQTKYTLRDAGESVTRSGVTAGARIGYRFTLGRSHLYIAPWMGLNYNFGELGASIGGTNFKEHRIGLFPTIHLGWAF